MMFDKAILDELRPIFGANDIADSNTEVLLVLESPYKDEVKSRRPLSGRTGAFLTEHLYEAQGKYPLGMLKKLVTQGLPVAAEIAGLDRLGVVNVSMFPMEKGAYPPFVQANPRFAPTLGALARVRGRASRHVNLNAHFAGRKPSDKALVETLNVAKRFRYRLGKVTPSKLKLVVLCGNVAQAFWDWKRTGVPRLDPDVIVHRLTHPSPRARIKDKKEREAILAKWVEAAELIKATLAHSPVEKP
jgi:uracil-DNA glycosylase